MWGGCTDTGSAVTHTLHLQTGSAKNRKCFWGFIFFSEFFCGFYCCSIFGHLCGFHCVFVPSHFYVASFYVFSCLLILLLLGYIVHASMYSQVKIKIE